MAKKTQEAVDDTAGAAPVAPTDIIAALNALLQLIELVARMHPTHDASHAYRGQYRIAQNMISRLSDG